MSRIGPFIYSGGFPSFNDALSELQSLCADGEIDTADSPRVRSYTARNGSQRWGVEVVR